MAETWKHALFLALSLTVSTAAQTPQELVQDTIQRQQAGDLEGAVAEYKEFLKMHPEATAVHSNLGASQAARSATAVKWGRVKETSKARGCSIR